MMGPTHRLYGATRNAAIGALIGAPPSGVAVMAGMGYACATFPDWIERTLSLPHRSFPFHAVEVPAVLAGVFVAAVLIHPVMWLWFPLGFAGAWQSHLEGDWVFGKAHAKRQPNGSITIIRPRGVPVFRRYYGLGLKVDATLERWPRWTLRFALLPVVIMAMAYSTRSA